MAALSVVLAASAPVWAAWSDSPPSGLAQFLFTAVVGIPVLLGASALLTAVYVLPAVALGHWFGRLAGHGRRWWWVAATSTLGLLPAAALITVIRVLQSGSHEWQQLALRTALFAGALGAASTPAAIAVHMTVLREDAGSPVRPAGDILLWGTLAVSAELTACLAYL